MGDAWMNADDRDLRQGRIHVQQLAVEALRKLFADTVFPALQNFIRRHKCKVFLLTVLLFFAYPVLLFYCFRFMTAHVSVQDAADLLAVSQFTASARLSAICEVCAVQCSQMQQPNISQIEISMV